jgi:hypothetical protein
VLPCIRGSSSAREIRPDVYIAAYANHPHPHTHTHPPQSVPLWNDAILVWNLLEVEHTPPKGFRSGTGRTHRRTDSH